MVKPYRHQAGTCAVALKRHGGGVAQSSPSWRVVQWTCHCLARYPAFPPVSQGITPPRCCTPRGTYHVSEYCGVVTQVLALISRELHLSWLTRQSRCVQSTLVRRQHGTGIRVEDVRISGATTALGGVAPGRLVAPVCSLPPLCICLVLEAPHGGEVVAELGDARGMCHNRGLHFLHQFQAALVLVQVACHVGLDRLARGLVRCLCCCGEHVR